MTRFGDSELRIRDDGKQCQVAVIHKLTLHSSHDLEAMIERAESIRLRSLLGAFALSMTYMPVALLDDTVF